MYKYYDISISYSKFYHYHLLMRATLRLTASLVRFSRLVIIKCIYLVLQILCTLKGANNYSSIKMMLCLFVLKLIVQLLCMGDTITVLHVCYTKLYSFLLKYILLIIILVMLPCHNLVRYNKYHILMVMTR